MYVYTKISGKFTSSKLSLFVSFWFCFVSLLFYFLKFKGVSVNTRPLNPTIYRDENYYWQAKILCAGFIVCLSTNFEIVKITNQSVNDGKEEGGGGYAFSPMHLIRNNCRHKPRPKSNIALPWQWTILVRFRDLGCMIMRAIE